MLKMIVTHEDLKPVIGTEGSAGYDLKLSTDTLIPVGKKLKVGTGVKVEIPAGFVGIVVPRSSTGKKGIELTNTVGIIDSDYQGEIFLELFNKGSEPFLAFRGDRVVQLVIVPCFNKKIMYVDKFNKETSRGSGGFGSTGEK